METEETQIVNSNLINQNWKDLTVDVLNFNGEYETGYFCFKLKPKKSNLEIGHIFSVMPLISLAVYCFDGFSSIGKKINPV